MNACARVVLVPFCVSLCVSSLTFFFCAGNFESVATVSLPGKRFPALRETRHTLSTVHTSFSLGAAQEWVPSLALVTLPRSSVLVCVHFFCARSLLRSRTAESNSAHAFPKEQLPATRRGQGLPPVCRDSGSRASCSHLSRGNQSVAVQKCVTCLRASRSK